MRISFVLVLMILLLLLLQLQLSASETPASGETLFRSASLGTNGKACASCHPQGKGLEQIGDYDDTILQEMVNFCIRDAMKGKMLPDGAKELRAIAGYMRHFQKSE